MRLVQSFLFAAIAVAIVAFPSHESSAFLMDGAGVEPIIGFGGIGRVSWLDVPSSDPDPTIAYTTKPGDKLRTKDGHGVLDRFNMSVTALRAANPDALVPVCVGARQDGPLTTCREIHWYLRERVTLTLPQAYQGRGHHHFVF